ncbi:mitochondrial ribosomal small subunit component [Rhodotorula kratochvilovae]
MLVPADPAVLKPWLIRTLEPLSDAEPAVLADYVLALLKRDVRDLDDLRQFCAQQLDDFLEQHTVHFVDSLLHFIANPTRSLNQAPSEALAVNVTAAPSSTSAGLKRPRSPPPPAPAAKHPRFNAAAVEPHVFGDSDIPGVTQSHDTSRVISVDNIPPTSLTVAAVRHFFQPFGVIVDLVINAEERTATITFLNPEQADRALASPQAVFGNRFVRVYRRPDTGAPPRNAPPVVARDSAPPPSQAAVPPMNSVAAASPPSRAELLQHNAAQQRALLAEVESADAARRSVIMASLRQLANEADAIRIGALPARDPNGTLGGAPSNREDALARLKALQREAASLGIDSASSAAPPRPSSGAARVDEHFQQRSTKRRHPQQFRLDNRSRKVRVRPVVNAEQAEQARAYFEVSIDDWTTFGTVVTFEHAADEQACVVEFESRRTAEQAMAAGAPPADLGPAQLSWADAKSVGSTAAVLVEPNSGVAAVTHQAAILPIAPGEQVKEEGRPAFTAFPGINQAIKTNTPIRTASRACTVLPNFIGMRFLVHNGKQYVPLHITPEMVGHKLGEFAPSRQPYRGKPAKR